MIRHEQQHAHAPAGVAGQAQGCPRAAALPSSRPPASTRFERGAPPRRGCLSMQHSAQSARVACIYFAHSPASIMSALLRKFCRRISNTYVHHSPWGLTMPLGILGPSRCAEDGRLFWPIAAACCACRSVNTRRLPAHAALCVDDWLHLHTPRVRSKLPAAQRDKNCCVGQNS